RRHLRDCESPWESSSNWKIPFDSQSLSRPPRVDQALALAGDVVDVLRDLRVLHLARPETAAKLSHELRLMVPALHVALGEHAAARVARQHAADLDTASLDERAALAFLAEAEAFQ